MIGRSGEKGSGISVLAARHDDDDVCYVVIEMKWIIPINECRKVLQKEHKSRHD